MGAYQKAEVILIDVMGRIKRELGENHPTYAITVSNLATLYMNTIDFDKAEPLYLESVEIKKKTLGDEHPSYALTLNNIGFLYQRKFESKKAEPLLLKAFNILKKSSGENSKDFIAVLANLLFLYQNNGNFKKAEEFLMLLSNTTIENIKNDFVFLSENEKGNYVRNKIYTTDYASSFLYNYSKASSTILRNNFDLQLIFKSLSLTDTRLLLEVTENSKDSLIISIKNKWQNNKKILSKQYALSKMDRLHNLDSLANENEKFEKQLGQNLSAFFLQQKAIRITTMDILATLQQEEAAIEFLRFNLCTDRWTDSIIYAAYILRKNDSVPVFVPLCEEKQLGIYFSSTAGSTNIKTIYRSDALDENDKPTISGDSLYALIWKPLMPYLNGIKKIDYSPAGLLYKIAFNALPTGDSSLLMDKFELNQYTSIRQLAITKEKKSNDNSIALFGNCSFSMDSLTIIKNIPSKQNVNTFITAVKERGENNVGWKQLDGTANEINSIKSLFKTNKTISISYEK